MVIKGRKKRTPSRIKYEQKRPTFSFRIYEELKARIQEVKKVEGISNTNIVEIAVDLLEVKVGKEKEVRDQAYDEGYEKGYEEARKLYSVTFPCKVCGKIVTVTDKNAKEAIKGYMRQHGWSHTDCVNRRY